MRNQTGKHAGRRSAAALLLTLLLAACGSAPRLPPSGGAAAPSLPPAGSGRGGYYQDDGPGDRPPAGLENTPDAVPKVEPYASGANKPYTVFGKTYTPFTDDRPFKQRGIGSWYGKKFHGQKTSSGELYDMYKMTAAHPTLPLPSYARVTNLRNGKQVIVRVNDRGPFHSDRIIDLSYTAALKLGYLGSGSSELEVERILPADIRTLAYQKNAPPSPSPAMPAPPAAMIESVSLPAVEQQGLPAATSAAPASSAGGFYLQFGAFAQADNAAAARESWQRKWGAGLPPIEMQQADTLYRLSSGPYASRADAEAAARQAGEAGLPQPLVLQK